MYLPFVPRRSSLVSGRFPQLLINPINFEALYDQKQAAQANPPSIN
jgi:preprotein translocase subunit SecB